MPERYAFPDNWIYVHAPEVKLGRIQNFGSWSPYMVKDGRTCLGLEYFVDRGRRAGGRCPTTSSSRSGHRRAASSSAWSPPAVVEAGYVVRMPKAYPVYDDAYAANVDVLRAWLAEHAANVYPVGRNGMHKYNNQDHSMYTAMLTVENIVKGTAHDIWAVNVEQEYHEERPDGADAARRHGPLGPHRLDRGLLVPGELGHRWTEFGCTDDQLQASGFLADREEHEGGRVDRAESEKRASVMRSGAGRPAHACSRSASASSG